MNRFGCSGRSCRGPGGLAVARRLAAAAAMLLVAASAAMAQDAHRVILGAKFQARLEEIGNGLPGVMGIRVVDLTSGQRFGVNDTLVFPQGSAIKVAVLVELFRQASEGKLSVDDRVTISTKDFVTGSQIRYFKDGTSAMSLHDLAVLMIIVSDNNATNLLIERVGMQNATRTMRELGLPNTRVQRKMIQPQESARGNENLSTPSEAARLMERIYRCDLPMSAAHCAEMRSILEIPHDGPIQQSVPSGIRVGQKTGTITGVRTNWGYVDLPGRPYALAVMGNYGESDEISNTIGVVADAAYAYFMRLGGATEYGTRVPVQLLREQGGRPPR
ncbi:MAG: serine hydrolase [Gemmatimonadetes bacterium]|nr:serine hydrolase [Gemmatimonadota bacterium]